MSAQERRFKKVVLWGYPLHTHTHSYIHAALRKAFGYLGYETAWLTDNDDVSGEDFTGTLFIAAGDQAKNMPVLPECHYVLHNFDARRYYEAGCKILFIQTHTTGSVPGVEDETCTRYDKHTLFKRNHDVNCLYLAWATDLLPHEIDLDSARNEMDRKVCVWTGTLGDSSGEFQNGTELNPFFNECSKNDIVVSAVSPWAKPMSFEDNRVAVNGAYLAPSIQGPWQVSHAYIPCRVFKNISYGHFGITNSAAVNAVFNDGLVYSPDPVDLFHKAMEFKQSPNAVDRIKELMAEVRDKHTYIQRIERILEHLPE